MTPVSEDPREINISPVSTGGAALSPVIGDLLELTRKSYVTLVILPTSRLHRNDHDELQRPITAGSGFIIDRSGHVLTAGHLAIKPGWIAKARGPDGRNYVGRVIAVKKDIDTALIKLRRFENAQPVQPVAQPCLKRGEPVFSLGKPRKAGDTAKLGEVGTMSFGRPVTYKGFGYPDAMVLKLKTRKGESGGPVFNKSGKLAGMVVSTLSDSTGRHLNLAHAVTTPILAKFVCENTKCTANWQALRELNTSTCPAS